MQRTVRHVKSTPQRFNRFLFDEDGAKQIDSTVVVRGFIIGCAVYWKVGHARIHAHGPSDLAEEAVAYHTLDSGATIDDPVGRTKNGKGVFLADVTIADVLVGDDNPRHVMVVGKDARMLRKEGNWRILETTTNAKQTIGVQKWRQR